MPRLKKTDEFLVDFITARQADFQEMLNELANSTRERLRIRVCDQSCWSMRTFLNYPWLNYRYENITMAARSLKVMPWELVDCTRMTIWRLTLPMDKEKFQWSIGIVSTGLYVRQRWTLEICDIGWSNARLAMVHVIGLCPDDHILLSNLEKFGEQMSIMRNERWHQSPRLTMTRIGPLRLGSKVLMSARQRLDHHDRETGFPLCLQTIDGPGTYPLFFWEKITPQRFRAN